MVFILNAYWVEQGLANILKFGYTEPGRVQQGLKLYYIATCQPVIRT
jgi:hypothetical protein